MRSHEFDNKQTAVNYFSRRPNVVGRLDLGEYTVFLDEHLMQQANLPERNVDEFVIQQVIPKISRAKAKIKTLDTSQSFYLYDNTNNVALGIKIFNSPHKIFLVKTVWPGRPSGGDYPIFDVA